MAVADLLLLRGAGLEGSGEAEDVEFTLHVEVAALDVFADVAGGGGVGGGQHVVPQVVEINKVVGVVVGDDVGGADVADVFEMDADGIAEGDGDVLEVAAFLEAAPRLGIGGVEADIGAPVAVFVAVAGVGADGAGGEVEEVVGQGDRATTGAAAGEIGAVGE